MAELRFDAFMEHALHHPSKGYYARRILSVGSDGDFSTSATLSNSLAKRIASWIQAERSHHQFTPLHILEIGAGTGKLMHEVRSFLPCITRHRAQFHLVETSEPLKKLQRHTLAFKKIHWHASVKDAIEATRGNLIIYSNELVDAFPVRVFRQNSGKLEELHINTDTRSEVFKTCPALPDSDVFSTSLPDQTRMEVHESYHLWLKNWVPLLANASVLTIDYGDSSTNLIRNNPRGSLRGYFRHNRVSAGDLYRNVGHQDITADVNFNDLANWGKALGLNPAPLQTQQKFLGNLAIKTKVDQFLADTDGAGTAFKVLIQRT